MKQKGVEMQGTSYCRYKNPSYTHKYTQT